MMKGREDGKERQGLHEKLISQSVENWKFSEREKARQIWKREEEKRETVAPARPAPPFPTNEITHQ